MATRWREISGKRAQNTNYSAPAGPSHQNDRYNPQLAAMHAAAGNVSQLPGQQPTTGQMPQARMGTYVPQAQPYGQNVDPYTYPNQTPQQPTGYAPQPAMMTGGGGPGTMPKGKQPAVEGANAPYGAPPINTLQNQPQQPRQSPVDPKMSQMLQNLSQRITNACALNSRENKIKTRQQYDEWNGYHAEFTSQNQGMTPGTTPTPLKLLNISSRLVTQLEKFNAEH